MQSQHPDDTKNMMLAVALAMAVLFGWNYFYAGPQMRAQQEKAQLEKKLEDQAKAEIAAGAAPSAPGVSQPGTAATAAAPLAATRDEALARSPRLAIETPSLKGMFSSFKHFIQNYLNLMGTLLSRLGNDRFGQ